MMMFLSQSLAHTSGEVRDAAERVIIALYREVGVAVREYLPADSEQTRKSIIYKQLFKEFAKIDGKLGLDDEVRAYSLVTVLFNLYLHTLMGFGTSFS